MYYIIEKRQPLGRWEFVRLIETSFEEAAKQCWQLLVENGGDAVETRFRRNDPLQPWAGLWTYLPQFLS